MMLECINQMDLVPDEPWMEVGQYHTDGDIVVASPPACCLTRSSQYLQDYKIMNKEEPPCLNIQWTHRQGQLIKIILQQ